MAEGLSDLRQHLGEKLAAKKTALVETEESLRKYVGDRAVDQQQGGRGMMRNRIAITAPGAGRGLGRRSLGDRLGSSGDGDMERDEEVVNKSVMSRVVKEVKSREETIEEQKTDKKSSARNKRMFGALVGTLQRFNKEEVKKKDVTEKQKEKLMKVEERTEKEKEEIKNRKRELFTDQKKKKQDIKILHIQMRRVEEYETWEKSKKQEANFIRTKADPPLYWLPKTISDKSIELQQATRQLVEKEVATRKEEFEEELLEIERKMTANLDRSRNGPRGDIRDRLDTSKNGKLDDTFESKDGEEDEGGFMADRVVVERDGERQSEVNGGDLRMTLKNNAVTERKKSEERTVIVKDEREVEERKKRKEEEKQKEEERRIRKEEEKRREQRKAEEEEGKKESLNKKEEKEKEASKDKDAKVAPKAKRRSRDSSSDSEEEDKSKKPAARKRRRTRSGRSSRTSKKEKKRDSSSDSSSSEEERGSKKKRSRSSSSSSDSEDAKAKKTSSKKDRKRGNSRSQDKGSKKSSKKRSKKESSSEDSSSDSD